DTSRQTKNLNKLLIRILLHLQVEFSYFNYLAIQKWGYSYDIRKDIYDEINSLSLDDLIDFYNQNIKPIPYHTAIIGQTKSLDLNYLKSLGTVQELSIEDLFGY
ncbi:hypothetical protein RIU45_10775, partial [Riemerella anatipestifer]|uniref:hypothetical protein n=1 Tax=Riemerella anatipestifer TaxID=34085 RepID=UPI00285B5A8C